VIACSAEEFATQSSLKRVFNFDEAADNLSLWGDQFSAAMFCNGSAEDQSTAGVMDWSLHAVCLPWKIFFALVPPAEVGGGWPCFVFALLGIGVVTAAVSDTASLLGCSVDVDDLITANTLVALGTSLPDTFASRIAAQKDDSADNSVGNVTGSNSVNVFLGLGISWTVAALYWGSQGPTEVWKARMYKGQTYEELFLGPGMYPDGGFFVPAGSLGFSVSVYTALALSTIAILMIRRWVYGGELGGPKEAQWRDSAILFSLWLVYLTATIVKTLTSG